MPPKAKVAAPIDRPLSRAYLREFKGWSTAYPPGLSDPTTLRLMENVMVNRDGSARVRPGLRYLSYTAAPVEETETPGTAIALPPVGSHEVFFLNDGSKAYLFAVRELDDTVGFRVLASTPLGQVVKQLTDAGIDFAVGAGLNFTAATTYVKYLQIDNKIFALSNAGEPMRRFTVGEIKTAKALSAIDRPAWTVADKLSVVHPDALWISSGTPTGVRRNIFSNPGLEFASSWGWSVSSRGDIDFSTAQKKSGTKSLAVTSLPARTNLLPYTLMASNMNGWYASGGMTEVTHTSYFRCSTGSIGPNEYAYIGGPLFAVSAGASYDLGIDYDLSSTIGSHVFGVMVRFYNSSNVQVGSDSKGSTTTVNTGRFTRGFTVPSGATKARLYPYVFSGSSSLQNPATLGVRNAVVCPDGQSTAAFNGNSGADYFWTGTANASASVYHPPVDVTVTTPFSDVEPGQDYWAALYTRGTTGRSTTLKVNSATSSAFTGGTDSPGNTATDAVSWATRLAEKRTIPAGHVVARMKYTVTGLPRGETHYIDEILFEKNSAGSAPAWFSGAGVSSSSVTYEWEGTAEQSASVETTYAAGIAIPTAETPTANTLISSDATKNVYNFGFFYTFSNEVGESAASQVTVVRTQRAWSAWRWETANGSGEPSGAATTDPALAADQLVASMPQAVFDQALAAGATAWNLYMFTWSDQAPVPSTAVRVATRELEVAAPFGANGWQRATPVVLDVMDDFAVLPTIANRYNYSDPSKGGQGLVAADRMVMVYDPTAPAVIRWSANQQGDYSNFTAAKGGGYKTLTSGNLYVPACVKLWQNPQSVDTLTILCMGVDSQSTAYYMMPAEVSQQSETTQIMGFEETTATPGTTSPYGVEVFNNALYHPLDDQLMKSTANNYNISHKVQTEQIRNVWELLTRKQNIVSSQYDGRLYFIVHNPAGETLLPGCMGNEIWVFDATAETGTWSRWLVQATSLRKIEQRGKIFMSVVRPDGIFYFDPDYDLDDTVGALGGNVTTATIPWMLETNTQGANRAHDAWCRLEQLDIMVGNFTGRMRYGVRGWDLNGKPIETSKIYRSPHGEEMVREEYFDHQDMLRIARDMKEWFFFAQSEPDEEGVPQRSFGQINLVQYRYAPVSVNAQAALGSVETFEYGHAGAPLEDRTTINGIPIPVLDARRP